MSLMDALLLDEYHDPHDSYVAARSDRLLGSGSLSDPWDAGVVTGAAQPVGTLSFDVKDVVVITAGVNPYNTSDQVQITIEVGPQAPPYTQTFVVTRLSSRAFKFSLSADPVSPPSALCRFTSAPSGPGTPPKMTVRLFWPVAKVMAVAHGVVEFDVLTIANATLFHFGILTSTMHMAWMRQVCGRLEGRYRYSNNIVYNNFPFPPAPASKQKERVAQAAQAVLDARLQFPDATLADLYDPNTMPKALLDAHRALDAAVDACYGKASFKTDLERLKFLFALYRQYTEPLAEVARIEEKRAKRKK